MTALIDGLAAGLAAAPLLVLIVFVFQRALVDRKRPQRWMWETAVIAAIGGLATWAWADTPAGWIGFGAVLFRHGSASIASRVGTAYERLVAMPGGDRHAVECIGKSRGYSLGAAIATAVGAILVGAWPAVMQLGASELYSRYRKAHTAVQVGPVVVIYALRDMALNGLLATIMGDDDAADLHWSDPWIATNVDGETRCYRKLVWIWNTTPYPTFDALVAAIKTARPDLRPVRVNEEDGTPALVVSEPAKPGRIP